MQKKIDFSIKNNNNTLTKLAKNLIDERKERYNLEKKIEEKKSSEKQIEESLITQMIASGQKSFKLKSGENIICKNSSIFYISPEKKDTFFTMLKKTGQGSLLKTDINYQTLQAIMKNLLFNMENAETLIKKKGAEKIYNEYLKYLEKKDKRIISVLGLKRK